MGADVDKEEEEERNETCKRLAKEREQRMIIAHTKRGKPSERKTYVNGKSGSRGTLKGNPDPLTLTLFFIYDCLLIVRTLEIKRHLIHPLAVVTMHTR